jgi:hypothetical protein
VQFADGLTKEQVAAAGLDTEKLEDLENELRGEEPIGVRLLPLVSVLLRRNIFIIESRPAADEGYTVSVRCASKFVVDQKSISLYARYAEDAGSTEDGDAPAEMDESRDESKQAVCSDSGAI